jgi:hypothetical protein
MHMLEPPVHVRNHSSVYGDHCKEADSSYQSVNDIPDQYRFEKDAVPKKMDSRSWFSKKASEMWLTEVLSCTLSLLCSASIIIVLYKCDGKPLPNWPHSITLNSLMALPTTLAKAGLVVPIAEALSQLKWVWFAEKDQPLVDFQTFDEASRTPFGGFKLLGLLKGGYVWPYPLPASVNVLQPCFFLSSSALLSNDKAGIWPVLAR